MADTLAAQQVHTRPQLFDIDRLGEGRVINGVHATGLVGDVVAVELTTDGLLLIADRLDLVDFPASLGIRPNLADEEVRDRVWDQVAADLTAQGVLDDAGQPHPAVAEMVDTLGRADRTLEGRWWRHDTGGVMVRFAVCRRGERHVVAAFHTDDKTNAAYQTGQPVHKPFRVSPSAVHSRPRGGSVVRRDLPWPARACHLGEFDRRTKAPVQQKVPGSVSRSRYLFSAPRTVRPTTTERCFK